LPRDRRNLALRRLSSADCHFCQWPKLSRRFYAALRLQACDWFAEDLTQGWIFAPNFRAIIEYERSLKEYPNIKVGEDFKGYQK
jgi:hypothetical protein